MSLVTENTGVIALRELDFWVSPSVQTSIESTFSEEIRPITQLNSGGHHEFLIDIHRNEVLRPNESTLTVRGRVKFEKKTSDDVIDFSKIEFTNNSLHSIFSDCYLIWQGTQLTKNLATLPYKNYLNTIIHSSENSRKTYLKCAGFEIEDPNNPLLELSNINITGADEQDKSVGKLFEFEGKLDLDLFNQHKFLIGGTKLKLVLVQHRPEFTFMCTDNPISPRIIFEDIYLNIRKSRISEELLYGQLQALNVNSVKYPITRNEVRSVTIDKGVMSVNLENLISGQMPSLMYVCFVDNEAFTGSYKHNPYKFENLNISSIAAFVNGEQFPKRAFTPNFPGTQFTREYLEFLRTSSQFNNDVRTFIDKESYKSGYTIFPFDLSQDSSDGYHSAGYVNIPRHGVLRMEIQFREVLPKTVSALLYCQWDNLITINQDLIVSTDY